VGFAEEDAGSAMVTVMVGEGYSTFLTKIIPVGILGVALGAN